MTNYADKLFIIAPPAAGKTTAQKLSPHLLADVDSMLTPSLIALTHAHQLRGDWVTLAALRRPLLAAWIRTVDQPIILTHSADDAFTMGALVRNVFAVLPPLKLHTARINARGASIVPQAATHGRSVVDADITRYRLPWYRSVGDAVSAATASRTDTLRRGA